MTPGKQSLQTCRKSDRFVEIKLILLDNLKQERQVRAHWGAISCIITWNSSAYLCLKIITSLGLYLQQHATMKKCHIRMCKQTDVHVRYVNYSQLLY